MTFDLGLDKELPRVWESQFQVTRLKFSQAYAVQTLGPELIRPLALFLLGNVVENPKYKDTDYTDPARDRQT